MPLAPAGAAAAADRSSSFLHLLQGFAPGEDSNARREDDEKQRNGGLHHVVVEARGGGGAAASVAATSGGHDYLDHRAASSSSGTMERLEVDQVQRKRLSADGYSRKRRTRGPIAEGPGVISISSIIQAGVKSAKAELVIEESISSPVARSPSMDCSPAMNTIDQPTLLFQSLKRVCVAAVSTGLTAKEAVAKIQEQRLPGLIDGGERLIVQVAKAFRSSSAFVEREERGRYFMQESSDLEAWESFQTTDSSKREEATVEPPPKSAETEFETIIEAAKQLQKLQEPIHVEPKVTTKSGTDHWAQALRSKSTSSRGKVEPPTPSTSQKASPSSRDQPGPRCNRDDGKGWRCVRMAEAGFSLCKYHRDQIRRAEIRRRKARNKSKKLQQQSPASPSGSPVQPAGKPSNPTSKEVAKAVRIAPEKTTDAKAMGSDNELHDHKRRRFVKAKSLRSLL